MATMKVMKHLHTYERVKHKTRKDLYKCADPTCTHRINAGYLEGRLARCYLCGNTYVVRKKQLYLKRLHCDECTRSTKAVVTKVELEFIERALERVLEGNLSTKETEDTNA